MDNRLKKGNHKRSLDRLNAFRDRIQDGSLSVAEAVIEMQKITELTQVEFAKDRGISLGTLKDIQSGNGNPKLKTLNDIGALFHLEIAFRPKQKKTEK